MDLDLWNHLGFSQELYQQLSLGPWGSRQVPRGALGAGAAVARLRIAVVGVPQRLLPALGIHACLVRVQRNPLGKEGGGRDER